jgi:peptide/nickel transport system permease protein
VLRYPVRVALNPIMSTIGWQLPAIVSGETIVSLVLGLPTTGPLLYTALITQDMYLAASFIMILSALTILGTLLSDILLAWIDPLLHPLPRSPRPAASSLKSLPGVPCAQ